MNQPRGYPRGVRLPRRASTSLELSERTAIILTADHGEALFEHRFIGHNTQLYDESVHVPLISRDPEERVNLEERR